MDNRVILTPLKRIFNPKGDIYHAMKSSDIGYRGFGEAYFTTINQGEIKGWKKHNRMTLNLVVIVGRVKFVIYDEITRKFSTVILSPTNYQRLTINPQLYLAFKGLKENNIILNIANLKHDPYEVENLDIDKINYEW